MEQESAVKEGIKVAMVNISVGWRTRPELAQHQIAQYWHTIVHDGLVESCFYDGSMRNYNDFFTFVLDKSNLFLIFYEINTTIPLAHVLLNGFEGYACRAHFGMTREAHKGRRSLDIATQGAAHVFSITRQADGTPLTRTLVGVTPTRNRLACRFIQQMGFRPVAVLDKSCYYARDNTYSDGLMTILTKAKFEEEPHGRKE